MAAQDYIGFWSKRPFHIIGSYPINEWKAAKQSDIISRVERVEQLRSTFFNSDIGAQVAEQDQNSNNKAEALCQWAINKSWSYCPNCKILHREKLLPSFDSSKLKTVKCCPCSTKRYHIPQALEIPFCLHGLTRAEILALRPLTLHTGNYKVHQHGYRQKDGFCRVSWSEQSVLEKISKLEPGSYLKCMLAYRYLTTSQKSRYNHFIVLREQHITNGKQLNLYDYRENDGIECAIWPHLYPFHEWCETKLSGNTSRQSAKVSFTMKIRSEILDYSLEYDLLQFVYDRWVFTTVSGAISSSRALNVSAATALSTKTFSVEYWKWHHRYLVDAVRQFGYPDVFITISPYEWTFPTPLWLENAFFMSAKTPTQLAPLETLNIVHILEQTVRGYLCGTNSLRWRQHLFNFSNQANKNNVKNLFYRIEFQGRGTAHIHLLVWLEDLTKSSYEQINADIPNVDKELAFLVHDLQQSHKTVLPLNENPTCFTTDENGKSHLSLHYPQRAFALKLRAYISSILPFLKCRMDVQFSDQAGMLMRYVTNYVSKFKDSQSTESLYSTLLVPAEAAYRHLRDMKPCEPEMVMSLSSVKMAWSTMGTKSYVPPRPSSAENNSILMKYHRRNDESDVSFLDFLRTHDTSKANCPLYKRQKCLVGVKYVSYFNPHFFFQFLLIQKPHKKLDDLKHPNHETLPDDLKYFASCLINIPELLNEGEIRDMLQKEGHKTYFIDNVVNYVCNMRNIYQLWQIQILRNDDFLSLPTESQHDNLDPMQTAVVDSFKSFLRLRTCYYDSSTSFEDDSLVESQLHRQGREDISIGRNEWTKIISLTGKAGTGKTKCLHSCIQYAIENQLMCLVAAPTGYLASSYRAIFDQDIDANTIHSSFCIPIDGSMPQVNWALAMYDLIIIDEVSMVPLSIFNHILSTLKQLATPPILLICGDTCQLPPIITVNNRTTSTTSVYNLDSLPRISRSFKLTRQHRCVDEEYSEILNHLLYWRPTLDILDKLHEGRLLHESPYISDTDLLSIIRDNASSTFVTVSRNAVSRINTLVLQNLFTSNLHVAKVQMDNDDPPTDIFKGMRIILTQNRDKKNGVVNGQPGIILMMKGLTILIKLPNGKTVSIYPVSTMNNEADQDGSEKITTCFPFVPGYAITICKSQGQTLENVVVWFDTVNIGQGGAYVALSRVKTLESIKFLTPLLMSHFHPVASQ
jgi:hypothetical protein